MFFQWMADEMDAKFMLLCYVIIFLGPCSDEQCRAKDKLQGEKVPYSLLLHGYLMPCSVYLHNNIGPCSLLYLRTYWPCSLIL